MASVESSSRTGGRPSIFDDSIIVRSIEYIDSCEDVEETKLVGESDTFKKYETKLRVNIPTIEGLARHLRIHRSTIYEWGKSFPEFSDIIEQLQQKQAERLLSNGLSGAYNSTIAKVLLTKHGYTDKQEVEQKTTIEDNRVDLTKLTDEELRTLAIIQSKGRASQA